MPKKTIIALVGALFVTSPAFAIDLNPFGFIANVVEAIAEDRSADDISKDLQLKTAIVAAITDQMGTDIASVSTDVYEQDVMLTGVVESKAQKSQAGKIAKTAKDSKKIYNEIIVHKKTDEDKGVAEGFVDDTIIEKKTNALLLDGKGVNVTNFRWRSVGGHVFLFGRALSADEKAKATRIVKDIKGVTKVTNLAKVRAK